MNATRKVLFVCAHNAARSRMAAAFLRELGGDEYVVASAGFEACEVDPLVIEAMALAGVPLGPTRAQPTVFELFKAGHFFHYVISVCDQELGEKCPLFPGVSERITWSFRDPRAFVGDHAERLARVIEVRDEIRARIKRWLEETRPGEPVGY